jgi:hypothetical protein
MNKESTAKADDKTLYYEIELLCPLRNFLLCHGPRCAWYIKYTSKDGSCAVKALYYKLSTQRRE